MIDYSAWQAVKDNMARNVPEYLTFGAALLVAGVCTMPQKMPLVPSDSRVQELWTWMRDALQTAVPAARARIEGHTSSTVSTPNTTTTHEATASQAFDTAAPLVPPQPPTK